MNDSWIITGANTQMHGVYGGHDIAIADGLISEVATPEMRPFEASGLIAMPGLIDLHGDGFERHIAPRNGVEFDLETALLATDRELISNGITTAYLAMTISWSRVCVALRGPVRLFRLSRKCSRAVLVNCDCN